MQSPEWHSWKGSSQPDGSLRFLYEKKTHICDD